jgi:predicted GH43/DUF377 family glycosyl hydrolase
MPSSLVELDGKIWLYYSGWSRRTDTPYANFTGLAESSDQGLNFKKVSQGPVLTQDTYDPFSATSPCVIKENGVFHCFYCSGTAWIEHNKKYEHVYDIKYASSKDGIHWQKRKGSIIAQQYPEEALTRPAVVKIGDTYHMWFCARGTDDFREGINAYKIGMATSKDLLNWQRGEHWLDLKRSDSDSQMQAYPSLFVKDERLMMLYNGNGFGQSGILLASTSLGGF